MACLYVTIVQPSPSLVGGTTCIGGIDAAPLFDNLKLAPLSKERSVNVVDIDDGFSNSSTQSFSMYMLVSPKDRRQKQGQIDVVLYRIDLENHYDSSSSSHEGLLPLLVFPGTHPRNDVEYFSCTKFGSKLYFFGLDYYLDSFGILERSTNVYTIEHEVLMGIKPSEENDVNNFKHLFAKTKNPMFGPKYVPIIFVADQKLYVMSKYNTRVLFEVFSPVDETWKVLPTPGDTYLCDGVPVVSEKNHTFYYIGFGADTLLSFNLQTNEWTVPPDFFSGNWDDLEIYPRPPQAFLYKCVSLIGDMAFGYVYDHDARTHYVCASRGEEPFKPELAPHPDFSQVLKASRFTYMSDHHKLYSDYIVAVEDLDGKQVLCFVTYGTKLPDETKTSYVALSFFDIPGDFYTSEERECDVYASYADEKKAEDGAVVRRYFNAKFLHTAHFIVNTSHLCTHGQLSACFF